MNIKISCSRFKCCGQCVFRARHSAAVSTNEGCTVGRSDGGIEGLIIISARYPYRKAGECRRLHGDTSIAGRRHTAIEMFLMLTNCFIRNYLHEITLS